MEENETGKKVPTAIEQARDLLAEIKKENEKKEAMIQQEQEMRAENMLSGNADAGQPSPEKKEVSPVEYAKKVLANDI
jgi:hypothetical protein